MTTIVCRVITGVTAILIGSAALATDGRGPTTTPGSETLTLVAAGAAVTVDPAGGKVTSIRLRDVEEMATEHLAGSEKPFGYLEVIDLRDHRRYSPVLGKPSVVKWSASDEDDEGTACFEQQYDGAPFAVRQTFRQTPVGVRWEATLRLLEGQDQNRSVRVDWVLPLPYGWYFWGPNSAASSQTNGVTPYRVVYGHTDPGTWATVIPLVGVWGEEAGAAVFSPPDVRKCQISFDVFTQDCLDAGRGVFRQTQDLQSLRVAHHMVGLRPGRELRLAICIAGTRPDWRGVLGHYVNAYPELFEPAPAARKYEGLYGITSPAAWVHDGDHRRTSKFLSAVRATCVEVHAHFLEYGYYIDDDVVANPDKEYRCRPHDWKPLTYAGNRRIFGEMLACGAAPFLYFHNVHARPETVAEHFAGLEAFDERGEPQNVYRGEWAVAAQVDNAFGRHLVDQLKRLISAYPEVPGFFVDNYSGQRIDFAHDDGVTMVHNRPAYDFNRNLQDVGTECLRIGREAGKVMMINKLATIESAKGADMVLVEALDPQAFVVYAFACVNRAFFPFGPDRPRGEEVEEHLLQLLLIWGGTPAVRPSEHLALLSAYRSLTDALIGKRWVFDEDPLTLPAGYEGQIFRIDPHAPHAGNVVVTVVDPNRSWKDRKFSEGATVTVRLPEAAELSKATWLSVERSDQPPMACQIERTGRSLKIHLPPVGAAGILRLSG